MNSSTENLENCTTPTPLPFPIKFNGSHKDTRNSSINDSSLDNLPLYTSFNESDNSSFPSNSECIDISTDFEANEMKNNTNVNPSIQSENEALTPKSQEIDRKSLLTNSAIFEIVNPNLSNMEISSSKENEYPKNSVFLLESPSDEESPVSQNKQQPQKADKRSAGKDEDLLLQMPESQPRMKYEKHHKNSKRLVDSSKPKSSETFQDQNNSSIGDDRGFCVTEKNGNITTAVGKPEKKLKTNVYDTLEEFENNLPPTVTVLDTPFGSKVYLVGTAHFSEESQDDVSYVIRNVRPDVVMVELCPSRIHILKLDEKSLLEEAKSFNLAKIRSIIQTNGYINGIFFILLLQMSAQIAKDLGMAPGGEFRRAFEEIHKLPGCMLHLGDRPIRITLQRALRALSLWQTIKLVWKLTSKDTISLEEVEECKQRDLLEKLMQELAGEFPAFSDVFVKERDLFLCHSLQLAALPQERGDGSATSRPVRVVGVVGIGHASGIARNWGHVDPQMIPPIMEIPPSSTSTRLFQSTVKCGLIGLTIFGAFKILRPRISRFF